jgi:hypothetical protein
MTKIQVTLMLSSLIAAILAKAAFRSQVAQRLLLSSFFAAAAFLVAVPDAANAIAHKLGVGHGADLLLYFALTTGAYGFLLLYQRMRKLDQRVTEQIRFLALRDAKQLPFRTPERAKTLSTAVGKQ